MRQADSPHGQAILQLLFLKLDGCLKWKPFDGPLCHPGALKKWARAALQAFKKDKVRSTEAVRDGDEIPIKEEEGQLPTDGPRTCETTLDPLDSVHQRRGMDHCSTSRPLDLGPLSHAVRFDPYPTPSLSPPPVFIPQYVEGQDERPHASVVTKLDGCEVAPQRLAFDRPFWEENLLPQPFRPPNDRRQEAKLPPPPPPSEPPFFAPPVAVDDHKPEAQRFAQSRRLGISASWSPTCREAESPRPPPVPKARSVGSARIRRCGEWGLGTSRRRTEDQVEEGRPSRAVVAAGLPVAGRGAAWAPTTWPSLPQKVLEVLEADHLPDHHVESTPLPVKPPATSSAVPSSWTAWYNDCLDPI
ncbi:hypothetical protein RHOSPDRAFT_34027 [Rhodotorula sp. JG-1b]|nr:hypothetical protein RHOSPDRAFT_34027 [Rhodotorula sp. JG-1b]